MEVILEYLTIKVEVILGGLRSNIRV